MRRSCWPAIPAISAVSDETLQVVLVSAAAAVAVAVIRVPFPSCERNL